MINYIGFCSQTMQARNKWIEMFCVDRKKSPTSNSVNLKLPFRGEGKIKTFSDK